MEIKNKGNNYLYVIIFITFIIGCLVGVNIAEIKSNNVNVNSREIPIETKIVEVPIVTQTVNVNTDTNDENKNELKININTATSKELQSLPGVGEDISNNIIVYRKENGSFFNISELMNVPRIGTITFEKIKNKVVID